MPAEKSSAPTSRKPARVLLVDDHPMVRERLREAVQQERDLVVCGEADERHAALAAIECGQPDLVTIDLTLKNSNGLELIKDIHARWPALPVLVVSMHDESLHAERAIRAGARGYITKQEATRKILEAIRRVLSGELYLSGEMAAQLAAKMVARPGASQGASVESLTDRELQVFEFIGQGHGTRQIAEALHLDVKTIETYRARIKEKLQLKDAAELLQYAIRWNRAP